MIVIERPNKKAVSEAIDIYRDSMRSFTIRHLKRVRGGKPENLIMQALHDGQGNQFQQNLQEGRSVEAAIDVGDFPRLIQCYWRDAFRDAFKPGSDVRDKLFRIAEARNRVSHPPDQDIKLEYAMECLKDISSILTEINTPEQSQVVENIMDDIKPFTTSAHRFRQGGRDVYAFALDLETLDNLLPDRIDDNVVKDANRPLTASHAKGIQKYLSDRNDWLLGTLLLGISPRDVGFESYPGSEGSVGKLSIYPSGSATMKMFDGQHRRRAIKDVLNELSHSQQNHSKLSSLKEASLPVMMYAEDRIKSLRQMFADAAKTKSIERNAVTRFDQRDAFNRAALWIAEESDMFAGRVEMERTSVPRSSHGIIAINQLAMTLKTIEVGYSGRVSRDRNDSYMLNLDPLYEKCLEWADDFIPSARDEYNALISDEIDNSDIPGERAKTMAYNATVIRIFAGCYYEWTKDGDDWKLLADFLRGISLQPGISHGSLLVDTGVVAPGGISPSAQRRTVIQAIDYIVQQARKYSS